MILEADTLRFLLSHSFLCSNETLLWVIALITFFMSAILDNLTSTIVMVSLLRKLIKDPERRKYVPLSSLFRLSHICSL